jgi:hypothetical protein
MSYFDRTRGRTLTRLFTPGIAILAACAAALALAAAGCGGSSGGPSPSSGVAIWTTNQAVPDPGAAGVLEFTQNQLRHLAIADVAPKKQNLSGSFFSPQDTLFDFDDDLFVVDGGDTDSDATEAVYVFTPKQLKGLKKNDAPKPVFTISTLGGGIPFVFPQFGVFDSSGNLWVSDTGQGVIFKFTAQQLTATTGVGITPAAVLESEGFDMPLGMVFDGGGNMWVANNGGTSLVKILASTLSSATGVVTDTPIAATFVSNDATPPSINGPWGLAFDDFGDLWVTNEQNVDVTVVVGAKKALTGSDPTIAPGSVVEFSAATVSAASGTSTPTPAVVLTPTTVDDSASIDDPQGLSIDLKDDFAFIANAQGDSLSGFSLDGIVTGSPTPNVFVFGTKTTLNAPAGLIIGPAF